jgi:zeta-carotene desaturase
MANSVNASEAGKARVVVIGGGLAGIAAAVRLAEEHVPVTVVETRKRLGGRATSFTDPTTADVLDNCQHVLMRCCTNLIDLYDRLGVSQHIQWHQTLYFTDGRGRFDRLEADGLPAPLHLMRSMMGFRIFSLREKLEIARGMWAIIRTPVGRRGQLGDESFGDWLHRHHQSQGVIDRYWSPVIVGACNEQPARVAANYALQVFQEGFLQHEQAYEMGLAAVPLVRLYDPAEEILRQRGGTLMLSSSAEALDYDGGRVRALRLADGRELKADYFISTVPFDRLAKLCSPMMVAADGRLGHLDEIEVSPIIGIHMYFRCPGGQAVMDLPHMVLADSPLQWVFNKGLERAGSGGGGEGEEKSGAGAAVQHLHGVISAAHDLVDQSADQIASMAVAEVRKALPGAMGGQLQHVRVVKEKRATFSVRPGIDRLRPGARGGIGNLFLAGDWCASGWPATMEGAVRSGYLAAEAVMREVDGCEREYLAADLPVRPLYRLLSR